MPTQPLSSSAPQIASYPHAYRRMLEREEFQPVFCAKAVPAAYADWWGVPQNDRLQVLYNGFDWPETLAKTDAKSALGIPVAAPVIGTAMRISDVKQPLVWAQAAIDLAQQNADVHFLIVGDGPQREAMAEAFAEAGLSARVHMPGQVSKVGDYLAVMDVFWQTSRSEGLPNALIEAQFSGVPALAFNVGGVAETFVDGVSGIAIAPDDSDALVSQSMVLLQQNERLAAMSDAAKTHAERLFSSEAFFANLSGIYSA